MSWKNIEEMEKYFEEEFGKEERREIEEFLGDCEDYEFYEDVIYGESFIVRKGNEYFIVSSNWDKFVFDRLDEEDVKKLKF